MGSVLRILEEGKKRGKRGGEEEKNGECFENAREGEERGREEGKR